jgi:hypothetical protein
MNSLTTKNEKKTSTERLIVLPTLLLLCFFRELFCYYAHNDVDIVKMRFRLLSQLW